VKLGITTLDKIAKVGLGFKSLQNQFFYLEKETITTYEIESKYLKPILQLADLDADAYKQTVKPSLRVFWCKDKEQDLRGTGALEYIRAMEKIPASEKKQAGKKQTIKSALQAQTSKGGTWYMPKAKLHKMNVWLRKGIGSVFSPIIFENASAVDQRCNYFEPLQGIDWRIVAAVLTSSLFVLSAESYGSASMGAGVLELATTMAHGLRVVDVRGLKDKKEIKELIDLAEAVWTKSKPVDWEKIEKPPQEVQDLDKWFLEHLETSVTLGRIYTDILETMQSRKDVAEDKNVQTKQGELINIKTVANGIAESVRPLLESQSFPESFVTPAAPMQPLDFSGIKKMEGQYPRSTAQVIVKALLMGRRKFSYPTEKADGEAALQGFSGWFPKILEKISIGIGMTTIGTGYEEDVHDAVFKQLHMHWNISEPEFYGSVTLD